MITEDYVSFEIAKLLKEKGFNEYCMAFRSPNSVGTKGLFYSQHSIRNYEEGKTIGAAVTCPTLQMAMKWLREVHNIAICTSVYYPVDPYELSYRNNKPYWKIRIMNSVYSRDYDSFNTYEEACESAIKYCLKNLI